MYTYVSRVIYKKSFLFRAILSRAFKHFDFDTDLWELGELLLSICSQQFPMRLLFLALLSSGKVAPFSTTSTTASMTSTSTTIGFSALAEARKLQIPSYEEMLRRDMKVYDFWNSNEELLEKAWKEWNEREASSLPKLDGSIINPALRAAVEAAWKDPTPANEAAIKSLWKEVAPGVYVIQLLDLEQVSKLRKWFDTTAAAGIPTRPPYGITLNRKGVMVDPRSVGYLAAPDFQSFYRMLVDEYIRPLGRLFFPEHIRDTDDDQSFAFSIQYQGTQGGDKSIRHHTDGSTVTFNINFDESQTWTGSSLIFFSEDGNRQVTWNPGFAVMHLGKSLHAALPIESGTRSNLVVWTMGQGGHRAYGSTSPLSNEDGCYAPEYQLSPKQRWTKPEPMSAKPVDRWSPF